MKVEKIDTMQNEVQKILDEVLKQGLRNKETTEQILEKQAIAVTIFFRIKAPEFIEFDKEWVVKLLTNSKLVPAQNIDRIAEGLKAYYPIKAKGVNNGVLEGVNQEHY